MALGKLKSYLFILFINLGALQLTCATEEVVVVHAPDSIKFLSNEPVRSSYLGDIFSSMLGYTIRSNIGWSSLASVEPWRKPQALVVLELIGFDTSIDLPLSGDKFLLENRGDFSGQYDLAAHRTEERYFGKNPVMLHMDLSDELHDSKVSQPALLKSLPADPKKRLEMALSDTELGSLVKNHTFDASHASDVKFLTEIATMREFLKAVSDRKSDLFDKTPDIFWFKVSGLDSIVTKYGPNSKQFKESLKLLKDTSEDVEKTMRNVYDDNLVITVIKASGTSSSFEPHIGRKLLALAEATSLNLAARYDPLFPVIFAILIFVFLVLVLAVLGISVAMWHMDPGRDSLIYRMTSQRIKKD